MALSDWRSLLIRKALFVATLLLFPLFAPLAAADPATWQKPPKEVLDVLLAPQLPDAFLDPTHKSWLMATPIPYPSIEELAQPMHKLAGTRVVERNRSHYAADYWSAFDLVKVADGSVVHVALPAGAKVDAPDWSVDGKGYAFALVTRDAMELWTGESGSPAVRKVDGVRLNPFFGWSFQWMPDQRTLLVNAVPANQGNPPAVPAVPPGPNVKEASGGTASSTYEVRDVLASAHDEELLDYFGSTQLLLVDAATGRVTPIGAPGLHIAASPSPDGHILVETIHRPYSRLTTYDRFPREVDVWDAGGNPVKHVASLPLHESVPIWGEPEGPREFQWRATAPATLLWVEALDGGDWDRQVPQRDKVMVWKAPFAGEPTELLRTEQRFGGFWWSEVPGFAFVSEYDSIKHWRRVHSLEVDRPGALLRKIWDLSADERYKNPGYPLFRPLPSGQWVVEQEKDTIWLRGQGASPDGDRPFLDRMNLKTLATERLFRSGKQVYESFQAWLDRSKGEFLVRRESPTDPPNYHVRTLGRRQGAEPAAGEPRWSSSITRQVTHFADPTPQIRGISKRLVTYKRADGVDLSFTLYLPPGYKEGTRLPAVLNAYPLDYTDPKMAGQVFGSTQRFTTLGWQHELFFLLEGYAVIENPSLPVVGDTNRIYDTYMEQLLSGARAAVDKAVELGVVDRDRIGVMGHSHGALMTVNLLTHSDLFRTGIARSGAYNRSLTAFGFQNERRTLWQATDVYVKVSPFFHVDQLKLPLLLIHGEADVNPGTVPLQSELLYEAIRGNGGTVRLVTLPYESHGYAALESNEHVLAEQFAWFERYVKNAPPKPAAK
jgi:dipeptidyl aminopeptidase/acylaminoacyl peptidase